MAEFAVYISGGPRRLLAQSSTSKQINDYIASPIGNIFQKTNGKSGHLWLCRYIFQYTISSFLDALATGGIDHSATRTFTIICLEYSNWFWMDRDFHICRALYYILQISILRIKQGRHEIFNDLIDPLI